MALIRGAGKLSSAAVRVALHALNEVLAGAVSHEASAMVYLERTVSLELPCRGRTEFGFKRPIVEPGQRAAT